MTGRQITVGITVGLCALALAGCHKKEAAKPPAPTAETPATPPATPPAVPPTEAPATPPADTAATPPPASVDPTGITPTPPTPGVTPTTTADAPPTFVPLKPIRVIPKAVIKLPPRTPGQPVTGGATDQAASQTAGQAAGQRPPPIRIGKTAAQTKAEKDILGLWVEQKNRKDILNFTTDGAVAYREKITDKPKWTGHWKAGADGVVQFDLAMTGATSSLQFSAYPTAAQIMAIAPHWTKEWGGSGQYAYERMK